MVALAVVAIGMSVRPLLEQELQPRLFLPIVADSAVFVPDADFRVVADASSDARRWRSTATATPTSRVTPSAVTEAHLHVIGTDARLATVALDDGSVAWARDNVVAVAIRDATSVIVPPPAERTELRRLSGPGPPVTRSGPAGVGRGAGPPLHRSGATR